MPQNLTIEKSTLVQVMACCRQAAIHYLNQWWLRSMSLYSITRPQWVKCALKHPVLGSYESTVGSERSQLDLRITAQVGTDQCLSQHTPRPIYIWWVFCRKNDWVIKMDCGLIPFMVPITESTRPMFSLSTLLTVLTIWHFRHSGQLSIIHAVVRPVVDSCGHADVYMGIMTYNTVLFFCE